MFGTKVSQMTSVALRFCSQLLSFHADEQGAITVDFVVLTSAITLLGVAVVGAFSGETVRIANETSDFVASQQVVP
ncbi:MULTISPECIES: hypothetical protein [unclassified Yoonia]|uniref:hypothetical protein n=1 Tax=unclassified Yoonia TaxID=2629118 RepID=UPI002B0002BE|nr:MULTISPECIES: hypothetical protein [unclassified Yoonia]